MNNSLTFEAEPFELSSHESGEEEMFGEEFRPLALEPRRRCRLAVAVFNARCRWENRGLLEFEIAETFETIAPGGGRFDRDFEWLELEAAGRRPRIGVRRCVPSARIITTATAIARARAFNTRAATSLLWGNLVDEIEVNIFRCPRTAGRLSPDDFLQAVALFQRLHRLRVDGMLGPITWTRMKTIRAERDPFPRAPLNQGFDATPMPGLCEMHTHPAIDIGLVAGTPIPVVADGLVIYAGDVGTLQTCAVATGCATGAAIVAASGSPKLWPGGDRRALKSGTGPAAARPLRLHHLRASPIRARPARRHGRPGESAGRIIAEVGADCVGFSTGAHLHYVVVSGPHVPPGCRAVATADLRKILARDDTPTSALDRRLRRVPLVIR